MAEEESQENRRTSENSDILSSVWKAITLCYDRFQLGEQGIIYDKASSMLNELLNVSSSSKGKNNLKLFPHCLVTPQTFTDRHQLDYVYQYPEYEIILQDLNLISK